MFDDNEKWTHYETADGFEVMELGEESPLAWTDESTKQLIIKLRLELAQARAEAEAISGDAVARISGRAYEWRGHTLVMAVKDEEGFQRLTIQVPDQDDREAIAVSMNVVMIAKWSGGRLYAEKVLAAEVNDDKLPVLEVTKPRVPEWFDSQAKNETRAFLKASDGSSSVSELRVHLVWSTKRRGKVLKAQMVNRLRELAGEAVQEKKLGKLLAVNADSDHVHVALWLPANLAGSEAAGIIKSYTSRFLRREFPELKEHDEVALWQTGCFVGSIGAAGHLERVLKYINEEQESPVMGLEGPRRRF